MGDWEEIFKNSGKVFTKPQENMSEVISFFKKEKVKKVLDLGCGSGRHTVLLAKNGFEVYGTDISDSGLQLARKWLRKMNLKANLKNASCYEKFPFDSNFFNAVISTQVIHHNYHKPIKFCISEIIRVLKPTGFVFVTVSASRYKRRATKFTIPAPRTYIPLDGEEVGLPHYIYNKSLMKKDFKDFKLLNLHMDEGRHYCFLGKLGNPTKFEEEIYSLLRKVPRGRVTTYGSLAKAANSKAYRAVGRAMNKNPYAPKVPCHRVVNSDGTIGGFGTGVKNKIRLLKEEGVLVKNNRILNFQKIVFLKDKF